MMCAAMIPIALTLASTAVSAYSGYQASSYQAALAGRNAQVADIQARDALARGEQKANSERRQTAAKIGQQNVGLAASGIDVGIGMGVDIIGDTAALGEMDTQILRQNAERESLGHMNQAANYRAGAASAKSSGLWNTVGTVLGGLSQAAGQQHKLYPDFFSQKG